MGQEEREQPQQEQEEGEQVEAPHSDATPQQPSSSQADPPAPPFDPSRSTYLYLSFALVFFLFGFFFLSEIASVIRFLRFFLCFNLYFSHLGLLKDVEFHN